MVDRLPISSTRTSGICLATAVPVHLAGLKCLEYKRASGHIVVVSLQALSEVLLVHLARVGTRLLIHRRLLGLRQQRMRRKQPPRCVHVRKHKNSVDLLPCVLSVVGNRSKQIRTSVLATVTKTIHLSSREKKSVPSSRASVSVGYTHLLKGLSTHTPSLRRLSLFQKYRRAVKHASFRAYKANENLSL